MPGHILAYRLGAISAVVTMAGALLSISPGIASASTCLSWGGAQPVNPSGGDTFASVAALSPCDVWAVGSEEVGTASQTLTEHFNGVKWATAASSNPGGPARANGFSGVAVRSSTDAWAVGEYFNGTAFQTLIELLSGGIWEQVNSANPAGSGHNNELLGVTIESAKDAWAVGHYDTGTQDRTLIEHWDGRSWTQVPSPNPSATENQLTAVTATSAKNAWAVGFYTDSDTFSQTLILHWNGKSWKRVASPDAGGPTSANGLNGVAATSPSSAWAVGGSDTKGHPSQALIARWNGKKWQRVDARTIDRPAINGGLSGVTALSAKDAWAVGLADNPGEGTLAAHWNGTTWNLVRSPDLGSLSVFTAVSASSPTNIWATGFYSDLGPDFAMAFRCC